MTSINIVRLAALACAGVCMASLACDRMEGVAPTSDASIVERVTLKDGYEVVLEILHDGEVEWRLNGFGEEPGDAHIMLPALMGDEPLITSCDQDINSDGYPDLLVREFTGGAHCCTIDHLFALTPEGVVRYESIDYGHGGFRRSYYIQADDDDFLEIRKEDWTFAYWKMSFAESPAPTVLLDLRASDACGRPRWVFSNKNEPVLESAWQRKMVYARTLASQPDGPLGPSHLPGLVSQVLDLMYTGNADHARRYLGTAFEGRDDERAAFILELALRLNLSPYVEDILRLNKCDTLGELFAGRRGRFGSPR